MDVDDGGESLENPSKPSRPSNAPLNRTVNEAESEEVNDGEKENNGNSSSNEDDDAADDDSSNDEKDRMSPAVIPLPPLEFKANSGSRWVFASADDGRKVIVFTNSHTPEVRAHLFLSLFSPFAPIYLENNDTFLVNSKLWRYDGTGTTCITRDPFEAPHYVLSTASCGRSWPLRYAS